MAGICKLLLKAYSDNSFTSEKGEFVTTINPTNLKISSNICYSNFYSSGNNNFLRYNHSEPRVMSFSLLLDNTGIFPNSSTEIKSQLNSLESLLEGYQKDINEPYYVRVIWGTIDFKGKLNKLFINYSYIKEGGDPVRAQVDLEIIEQILNLSKPTSQKEQKSNEKSDSAKNEGSNSGTDNNNKKSTNNNNNDKEQANNNVKSENDEKDLDNDDKNNENDNPNDEKDKNVDNESNINEEEQSENNENSKESDSGGNSNKDGNNEENSENNLDENDSEYNEDSEDLPSKQLTVKAGDSLPSLISDGLKSMGMSLKKIGEIIKSAICKFAAFNLLDTIRKLIKGIIAKIPNLITLLKGLIKKAKDLVKKGVTYIKKKATNVKNKAESGINNIKDKGSAGKNKIQDAFNNIGNKIRK